MVKHQNKLGFLTFIWRDKMDNSQFRDNVETSLNPEDKREEYQPPELKNLGSVAELTKSTGFAMGADGAYS
jgi:hypothetical protein